MAYSQYSRAYIEFKGKKKPIIRDKLNPGSAFAAMANFISLTNKGHDFIELDGLIDGILVAAESIYADLTEVPVHLRDIIRERKDFINEVIKSLESCINLDPINSCCEDFVMSDTLLMFKMFSIPIYHGWVLDGNDNELNLFKGDSRKNCAKKVAQAREAVGSNDPLIKKLIDFSSSDITNQGLSSLDKCTEDGLVGILHCSNKYYVVYKRDGDLFTLEAASEIVTNLPGAVWKKLTVEEKSSFYVTSKFVVVEGQDQLLWNQALEWFALKMESKSTRKRKKKLKGKVSGALDRVSNPVAETEIKPDDATTSNKVLVPPDDHTDHCPDGFSFDISEEDSYPNPIADQFLKFLEEFNNGKTGNNIPYFEGIAIELLRMRSPKLFVKFSVIQEYDGNLAIDIQDESPGIHGELECSVGIFFAKFADEDDKEEVKANAKLEILNLPERKTNQKFLHFVSENAMVAPYRLYGGVLTNTPTIVGMQMGAGYLDYILDQFEAGFGWREDWGSSDMEVREKGTRFIITKECDDLTEQMGMDNLRNYSKILFPYYITNGVVPAFFHSFENDILSFPVPKKDSLAWKRYIKYLRSALLFKPPLVRSTLICEAQRVLSLQIILKSRQYYLFRKRGRNWRDQCKNDPPFSDIYKYHNDIAIYGRDKWENTHWHVLKFARHCIEHVQDFLMTMPMLHDPGVIELMVSNCLQEYLADSIRTIMLICDIDEMFSSTWGHYEASKSNVMPVQLTEAETIAFPMHDANMEEKLIVHVSARTSDQIHWWAYLDVYGDQSDKDPDLKKLKCILESEEFDVELLIDDSQCMKKKPACITITRSIHVSECKIKVQGPFCKEFAAILDHLNSWLCLDKPPLISSDAGDRPNLSSPPADRPGNEKPAKTSDVNSGLPAIPKTNPLQSDQGLSDETQV